MSECGARSELRIELDLLERAMTYSTSVFTAVNGGAKGDCDAPRWFGDTPRIRRPTSIRPETGAL